MTKIEWTEETWNPVTGCSKVSPGCAHCYAETLSLRYGWSKKPWIPANAEENVILHPERLNKPLTWKTPRRVFVNSMSDLFHEQVPFGFVDRVVEIMRVTPQHTYQILTKRPERMREYFSPQWAFLPNVWLGVSVENQRWTSRIVDLKATPAAKRFVSYEPALGPIDWCDELDGIDWLICGGESGPKARPFDPQWARDAHDACQLSGVAFFMKQLGGARPGTKLEDLPEDLRVRQYP